MDWLRRMLIDAVGDRTLSRSQVEAIWAFAATQPTLHASPNPPRDLQPMLYEWLAEGLITPSQAVALATGSSGRSGPWEPPRADPAVMRAASPQAAAVTLGGNPAATAATVTLRDTPSPRADMRRSERRTGFSPSDVHLAMVVGLAVAVFVVFALVGGDGIRALFFGLVALAGIAVAWRLPRSAPAPNAERATIVRAICADAVIVSTACAALAFAELCAATGFLETRTTLSNLIDGGTYTQVEASRVVFWTAFLVVVLSATRMVRAFSRALAIAAVGAIATCAGVVDHGLGLDWSAPHHVARAATLGVACAVVLALAALPRIPEHARQSYLLGGTVALITVASIAGGSAYWYFDVLALILTGTALALGATTFQWGLGLGGLVGVVVLDADVGVRNFHDATSGAAFLIASVAVGTGALVALGRMRW